MSKWISIRALLLSLVFLLASSAHSSIFDSFEIGNSLGISPFADWKTLHSEHFRVTYKEEQKEIAQKSLQYFEEAHLLMSGFMKWEPLTKMQVVIVDSTDLANGLTSAALRFGIILYPTPPESWFSTAFYDDWLRLLIIHEYTHFLNLDPVKGIYRPLRLVFGDVIRPNSLWPSWMLEGLAVYMETRFTKKGRGRSSYYEMILRAAVKENVLGTSKHVTLDKLGGPNPYQPDGETPYLFGYHLMNELAKSTNGDISLGELSSLSSERLPFLLNSTLDAATGKTWFDIWDQWLKATQTRLSKDIEAIEQKTVSKTQRLTPPNTDAIAAKLSPNRKTLVYTAETHQDVTSLFSIDMSIPHEQRKPTRHFTKHLGAGIAFLDDSKIIYSENNRTGGYTTFSDLFIYDFNKKNDYRLSRQARFKDPDYHADSKRIVFTTTENATTGLAIAVLEDSSGEYTLKNVEKVFLPNILDRVSHPSWSKDGKKIAFSFHKSGQASEEIYIYDLSSRSARTAVSNGAFNRFPTFTQNGNILYSSDLSGVDNVYEYRPSSKSASPITNMVTGAWFPTEGTGKNLIASVYRADGFGLEEITKTDIERTPQVSAPPAPPISNKKAAGNVSATEETSYSIFPSIWPRQWAPFILLSSTTNYYGGQLLGFDALDLHRYFIYGAYETLTQKPDFYINYENRMAGLTLGTEYTLESSTIETFNGGLLDYIRKETYEFFITHPFRFNRTLLQPRLGLEIIQETLYAPAIRTGIIAQTPHYGGASAQVAYSYSEASRLAVQTERGFRAVAGTKYYFLNPGPKNWKLYGSTKTYLRVDEHTVLTPSLSGAYVTKRIPNFQSSNVVVDGGSSAIIRTPIGNSNIDELKLRGYPGSTFVSKYAYVGSLDLQFPIARIFRGWKTYPFFMENLSGIGFAETAYFPLASASNAYLPSAGGGLKLGLDIFYHVPVEISVQYHKGFKTSFGGKGEVIFLTNLGSIGF